MTGASKGIHVALANMVVVAFGITFFAKLPYSLDRDPWGTLFLIVVFACVPAAITGAYLGHLAAHATMHRAGLLVIMIVMACLAVVALAAMFELQRFVTAACIPTAISCGVLERWTRPRSKARIHLA